MYPDRETFGKIVAEEPGLSAAGRGTLLALYDGPQKIPRILVRVNDTGQDDGKKEHCNLRICAPETSRSPHRPRDRGTGGKRAYQPLLFHPPVVAL